MFSENGHLTGSFTRFNRELKKACGRNPTPKNKLAFFKRCFNVIQNGIRPTTLIHVNVRK